MHLISGSTVLTSYPPAAVALPRLRPSKRGTVQRAADLPVTRPPPAARSVLSPHSPPSCRGYCIKTHPPTTTKRTTFAYGEHVRAHPQCRHVDLFVRRSHICSMMHITGADPMGITAWLRPARDEPRNTWRVFHTGIGSPRIPMRDIAPSGVQLIESYGHHGLASSQRVVYPEALEGCFTRALDPLDPVVRLLHRMSKRLRELEVSNIRGDLRLGHPTGTRTVRGLGGAYSLADANRNLDPGDPDTGKLYRVGSLFQNNELNRLYHLKTPWAYGARQGDIFG